MVKNAYLSPPIIEESPNQATAKCWVEKSLIQIFTAVAEVCYCTTWSHLGPLEDDLILNINRIVLFQM